MKLHHLAILLPSLLLLSNCSSGIIDKEVVVQKDYVKQSIPLQAPPRPVEFPDTEWFVVSEENLDEALAKIKEHGGTLTFMAMTPKGYENLAIGVNDLRRYILQQKQIIAYYEKAITGDTNEPPKK